MQKCDFCGNEYNKMLEIKREGDDRSYLFDSFECAIHKLAPNCVQCGVRILGHGMQAGDDIFCCANCARTAGKEGLIDHTAA